jgi:uncharacterized membrane protein
MVLLFASSGTPTFVTPEEALEYGQPINEWDSFGRRLTVEYKIATLPVLDETTEAYRLASERDRQRADQARNRALWTVAFARYKLHLIGFLIAVILVYFVGLFLASLIGRTTWRIVERLLYRIPIVRAIYPNIKQVTDFLFTDRQLQFSGVVAVQYPRKGIWSLGLVTGPPLQSLEDRAGQGRELMNVFIPSSPTPVTGYVITVYRDETIELGLSMDEVLRYTISGGVIKPDRKLPASLTSKTPTPKA